MRLVAIETWSGLDEAVTVGSVSPEGDDVVVEAPTRDCCCVAVEQEVEVGEEEEADEAVMPAAVVR